jgi:hypothetical protein
VNSPPKTYCGTTDNAMFCDGNGMCKQPTVTCGGDGECSVDPVAGRNCCNAATGTTCQAATCGPRYGGIFCDETSDCPPSNICCAYFTGGGGAVSCRPPSGCVSDPVSSADQVCKPGNTGECLTGSCQPNGSLPYFVCR